MGKTKEELEELVLDDDTYKLLEKCLQQVGLLYAESNELLQKGTKRKNVYRIQNELSYILHELGRMANTNKIWSDKLKKLNDKV